MGENILRHGEQQLTQLTWGSPLNHAELLVVADLGAGWEYRQREAMCTLPKAQFFQMENIQLETRMSRSTCSVRVIT